MATSLHKTKTVDYSNLAIKVQQLKDNSGNAVDVADLATVLGTTTKGVFTTIQGTAGGNLAVNSGTTATDLAGKTVRVNNITSTGTANSFIGMQVKPAQGANNANGVTGAEFSPRINDTFTGGTIIGLYADAYLKGTTGNLSGDVRALNLELVTDDAGTRTITGNVNAIRVRAAFSGTISGLMSVIRVEKAEAQTNSNQWGYLFDLTDNNTLVWDDTYTTEVNATGNIHGAIKVRVNGADRWIALYDTAPTE